MRKLAAVLLALGICASAQGETHTITTPGLTFSPNDLTIAPGDTVTWNFGFAGFHDTVSEDGLWNSTTAVATFSYTFQNIGTFAYYCSPHRTSGMTGVIRVVGGKTATDTSLSSSDSSSVFSQPVTFTATVTPVSGSETVSGTVDFTAGGAPLCDDVALDGSGEATCTTSTLPVGMRTISATYNGDDSFEGSSDSLVQTVGPAPTTTTLQSSQNPSGVGQSVTFTATVTVNAPASGTATGNVRFQTTTQTLCMSVPLSSGTASCTTSVLPSGSHSVTAQFLGSTNYGGSTSAPLTQTVSQPPLAPAMVVATATSATTVSISWSMSADATGYEVYRTANRLDAYQHIATTTTELTTTDLGGAANTTYLYKVRAINGGGPSPFSPIDVATTTVFTDPDLDDVIVKAAHAQQLQFAVNAMRLAAALPEAGFRTIDPGDVILADDFESLRAALDPAREAIGLAPLTHEPITAGETVISAVHSETLRAGTQ